MKLSKLIFMASLFALMVAAAMAQSKLPADVPTGISIYFHRDGGMSPHYRTVTINGRELKCEGLKEHDNTRENFTVTITEAELKSLYKVFVEHKFDLMKNLDSRGLVHDASVKRITLGIGTGKDVDVSMGANDLLSESDAKSFKRIADAIEGLVDKYSAKK